MSDGASSTPGTRPPFEPRAAAPTRSLAEVVEIIYLTHGCSCESHPSSGASAQCKAWRRRTAEQVAAALRPPDEGGMALRPCPECGALIRAEHLLCWDCALTRSLDRPSAPCAPVTRLSIPGGVCVHCGAVVGAALTCPGCGWVDPMTRSLDSESASTAPTPASQDSDG